MISDSDATEIKPAQGMAAFRKAEQAPITPPQPGSKEWEDERVKAGDTARKQALSEGKSKAVADAVALDAYTNYGKALKPAAGIADFRKSEQIAPAQGIADFRKMEQEGITSPATPTAASEPAKVATSAKVLASAEPAKVGDVLDKLKAEEAKGGPDFWDVIQAAAAGWGGQVPLYVQKELKRKEAETQLQQAETIAQKQAEIAKTERGEEQAFQREQLTKELANRLAIAGIKSPAQVGGLNLQEFTGLK